MIADEKPKWSGIEARIFTIAQWLVVPNQTVLGWE